MCSPDFGMRLLYRQSSVLPAPHPIPLTREESVRSFLRAAPHLTGIKLCSDSIKEARLLCFPQLK